MIGKVELLGPLAKQDKNGSHPIITPGWADFEFAFQIGKKSA